ncbi:uncharacterized protein LOC111284298 [Durio zibethinus]|uniref:Uncharacterized protein LOC111284298 n=1 Tax=Durio zibethinus TaxID=66656 RepID=A0A6P5XKP7_DURZI|nr:uncharacterized protein LOC111284298 [Durio zibethinus]
MASATTSFRFLTMAILMIVGTLVFRDHRVSAQCETSIPSLISQCSKYVQKSGPEEPPSQSCCNVVTHLDIPCICKYVTPKVEEIVSVEKVMFVARSCGLTLTPGMKCGSFVVPPV